LYSNIKYDVVAIAGRFGYEEFRYMTIGHYDLERVTRLQMQAKKLWPMTSRCKLGSFSASIC